MSTENLLVDAILFLAVRTLARYLTCVRADKLASIVHQSGELEELLEKNKIIDPESEPTTESQNAA